MTKDEAARIAEGLTEAQRKVWLHERFDPDGWEPNCAPAQNPLLRSLAELGLGEIKDGRCGFERIKDCMFVPTPLGLAVRRHLQETPNAR